MHLLNQYQYNTNANLQTKKLNHTIKHLTKNIIFDFILFYKHTAVVPFIPIRALANTSQTPHKPLANPSRTPREPLTNPSRTPREPLANPSRTPRNTNPSRTPHEPLANPSQTPHKPLTNPSRTPHEGFIKHNPGLSESKKKEHRSVLLNHRYSYLRLSRRLFLLLPLRHQNKHRSYQYEHLQIYDVLLNPICFHQQ